MKQSGRREPISTFVAKHFELRRCKQYVGLRQTDLSKDKQKCGHLKKGDCFCGQSREWHRDRGLTDDDDEGFSIQGYRLKALSEQRQCESITAVEAEQISPTLRLRLLTPWAVDDDTELYPCDTFGELRFVVGENVHPRSIVHGATAKYIRLQGNLGDCNYKGHLYKLMTDKNYWNMPKPELIIEVTGSAQDLPPVDRRAIEAFNEGLIQAARSANAWLVTGGTNCGVMKLVGQAVARHHMSNSNRADEQISCLGIASWGIIEDRDRLIRQSDENVDEPSSVQYPVNQGRTGGYSPLDPGHNYFILVDNGKEKRFGEEIKFRAELTAYLTEKAVPTTASGTSRPTCTPLVLLVIGGGPNTLETVKVSVGADSAHQRDCIKRPVVVLPGFGGAADLLAYAYTVLGDEDEDEALLSGGLPDSFQEKIAKHPALKRLLGADRCGDHAAVDQTIVSLRKILQDRKLITIVDIFKETDNRNVALDKAILEAIFKAKTRDPTALLSLFMLAQRWNQDKIAESILQQSFLKDKHTTLKEYISPEGCMEQAIVWGQGRFFELLVKYKVVDLNNYFSREHLLKHYRDIFVTRHGLPRSVEISRSCISFFRSILLQGTLADELIDNSLKSSKYQSKLFGNALVKICGCGLSNLFREGTPSERERQVQDRSFVNTCRDLVNQSGIHRRVSTIRHVGSLFSKVEPILKDVKYATRMRDLFMFNLLLKRSEFAEIVWRDSTEHLATALMGTIFLKKLAEKASRLDMHDLAEDYHRLSITWEDRTMAIITKCYDVKPDSTFRMLIRRLSLWQGKTVMELAYRGHDKGFIAHTAVQGKLKQIWYGRIASFTPTYLIYAIALFPLFWPFIVYIQFVPDQNNNSNSNANQARCKASSPAVNSDAVETAIRTSDGTDASTGDDTVDMLVPNPREYDNDASLGTESYLLEPTLFYSCRTKKRRSPNSISIFTAVKWFYCAPMVTFMIHSFAMLCFLLLFTYFILASFATPITMTEVIIWVWSFSFFLEELMSSVHFGNGTLTWKQIFVSTFKNSTRMISWVGDIFMLTSIVLRCCTPLEMYNLPHTTYALSCLFFWLNSLRIFYVTELLGPKVITLVKMFHELLFFLVIYIVLLFAFSVSIHALIHPREEIYNFKDFFKVLLHVAYVRWWNLAGVGLDDSRSEIETPMQTLNSTILVEDNNSTIVLNNLLPDADSSQYNVVAVMLLIVYLFLTNIMLLNMLIAMLSMKVEDVQADSFRLWRFSYYGVVTSYYHKRLLPAPFNLLRLIYDFFAIVLFKRHNKVHTKPEKLDTEMRAHIDSNSPEYTKLDIIEQTVMAQVLAEEHQKRNKREATPVSTPDPLF